MRRPVRLVILVVMLVLVGAVPVAHAGQPQGCWPEARGCAFRIIEKVTVGITVAAGAWCVQDASCRGAAVKAVRYHAGRWWEEAKRTASRWIH